MHTYDTPRRLPYTSPIPAMRPTPDTSGSHSATPIYDALYTEFRRLFRALPGDRSGEEDLGFTAFGIGPHSTESHSTVPCSTGSQSTGSHSTSTGSTHTGSAGTGPTRTGSAAMGSTATGSAGTGSGAGSHSSGSYGSGSYSSGSYSSGSHGSGSPTATSYGTRQGAAQHGTGHLAAHGRTTATWQPVARQHTNGLVPALPPGPRKER